MNDVACPICGKSAILLRTLSSDFLLDKHEKLFRAPIDGDMGFISYDQMSCRKCSLEFFWPMKAGSQAFYGWITRQHGYYPEKRWEWSVVMNCLSSQNNSKVRLLEIGCGTGQFIQLACGLPNVTAIGLDTADSSVDIAQKAKLPVYCKTLGNYLVENKGDNLFDFVVAFHCLEHVINPKEFVTGMLSALKPSGSLFISTPYSPMSFENQWFDPLNHPPHHMTRWNDIAFRELARQLDLDIRFRMPSAKTYMERVAYALNIAWFGPRHRVSNRRLAVAAISKPWSTIIEGIHQARRQTIDGNVAADVVLIELTRCTRSKT